MLLSMGSQSDTTECLNKRHGVSTEQLLMGVGFLLVMLNILKFGCDSITTLVNIVKTLNGTNR